MIKVAVVILNWNGEDYLKKFLPSVVTNTPGGIAEVWVADNGSTDNSIHVLKTEFPSVKILELDKNYGFTGGYNRALKQIEANYYVLLNSDIEVAPNWVEPVVDLMDKDDKIAAAMPKLLSEQSKQDFEYAGAAGGFIDKYGFPFCRGRIISQIEKDKGQYNEVSEIFWATGACMFVRADLYHRYGGLDDDFFAHMEEIDFCWRIKNLGYKVMYQPDSKVYHVGGGTLPNNNPRKLFLNYRNNLYLLYKNLPKGEFKYILFARMVLDGMSAGLYLLQGKWSFFTAVFKAHMAFYVSLGKLRSKRKQNLEQRTIKKTPHMYTKSIVFSFFLKGSKTFTALGKSTWS